MATTFVTDVLSDNLWPGSVCAAFYALTSLAAQTPSVLEIDEHRPIMAAVDIVERQAGIPINYEDPRYENEGDLQDVSTDKQRADAPGFRLMVPRRGRIQASVDSAEIRLDPAGAVRALLRSHETGNLPGRFTVLYGPTMLYVMPTQVRDARGELKNTKSPLSFPVTVPFGVRTVTDTFSVLLENVSNVSGERIHVGFVPLMSGRRIPFEATRESGRDALARLVGGLLGGPFSYRLLYDPTVKYYMLNIQPVRVMQGSIDAAPAQSDAPSSENSFFDRLGP